MAREKGYQGWTNYETWNVKLWIDNDPGSYDYWAEAAQEVWDDSDRDEGRARNVLTDRLKDAHVEGMPEIEGVYSDLLTAALQEVNWDEIADSLLEEVEDEEEEEEEEEEDEE